jgi:hypothetical protein
MGSRKPTVLINGIAATSGKEGQFWNIRSGASSPIVPLLVHADLDDKLAALAPPISLSIKGIHMEGPNEKPTDVTFKKLYLTRRESVERGHRIKWFIADSRWFLSKLWVFSDFSMRRPINEFKGFGVGGQEDFSRTPKFAWIPHTNRNLQSPPNNPQFASGDTDPENHRPWTAKQAIIWMLRGFFETEPGRADPPDIAGWMPRFKDNGIDNGRKLVNFRTNAPWPIVMGKLLRLAHTGMYVDEDGTYQIYDMTETDFPAKLGGYAGGGTPITQDSSRSRARNIRVYFRTEREIRFDFKETTDTTAGATGTGSVARPIAGKRDINLDLENVLILPQDVRDAASGKVFQRGAPVPIVEALRLWNQDPVNPPPVLLDRNGRPGARLVFSLDFIRKNIMSPALATKMTLHPRFANDRDQVFAARASALYSSYRKVFRIPPVWLDMIENIRAERTAIQDVVSGKRAPSPVFMDYFQEFSARYFHYKSSPKDLKAGQNVLGWGKSLANVSDFSRLPLDKGNPTPASISFVNKKQGIFKIAFLPDLYGNTIRYFPATFANNKVPVTLLGGTARTYLLSQMEYAAFWRFSTILTVTLRSPNDHRKLFFFDYGQTKPGKKPAPFLQIPGNKNTEADATGPNHEVLFSSTHAGIAWLDKDQISDKGIVLNKASKAEVVTKNGIRQVAISGGSLTNPAVLEDAADDILRDVKFKQADIVVGTFGGPGIDLAERDKPRGQVVSINIQHVNGKIEAFHDARQPPVSAPIFSLIPQSSQNFLWRLEGEDAE